jgi:hypothetical protein
MFAAMTSIRVTRAPHPSRRAVACRSRRGTARLWDLLTAGDRQGRSSPSITGVPRPVVTPGLPRHLRWGEATYLNATREQRSRLAFRTPVEPRCGRGLGSTGAHTRRPRRGGASGPSGPHPGGRWRVSRPTRYPSRSATVSDLQRFVVGRSSPPTPARRGGRPRIQARDQLPQSKRHCDLTWWRVQPATARFGRRRPG